LTALSFVLAFVGFALLVILHELGHFSAAKAVGMRVERFSLFFPPTIWKVKRGETEYAIGSIPAGGYVKISGMNPDEDLPEEVRDRAYHAQPVWKRIVVIAAGPLVNLVLAFVLLFVFFAAIGPQDTTRVVDQVDKKFPAAGVLKPGDLLVAVDGHRGDSERLSNLVNRHGCAGPKDDWKAGCRAVEPATLTIVRNGERRTVTITPKYDSPPGIDEGRMRVGFAYRPGPHEALPIGEAFTTTADRYWFITKQTLSLPARLINPEERKQISGVVGSYEVTRQTILKQVENVVGILAIISLSLAIVNLFPFLPLDGGHIFWAIVEKVRGRPVPLRVMERAGVVGFMLVILIFLIGLSNDIGRLSGEGFRVR
jgi:regulator of sigma E protease